MVKVSETPQYTGSDVADAMRSYVADVSKDLRKIEEVKDPAKQLEFYKEVLSGIEEDEKDFKIDMCSIVSAETELANRGKMPMECIPIMEKLKTEPTPAEKVVIEYNNIELLKMRVNGRIKELSKKYSKKRAEKYSKN